MFDITGKTLKPTTDPRSGDELERWWEMLVNEGRARKATEARQRSLSSTDIESLARQVFDEVKSRCVDAGVRLPDEFLLRLIGELSGMGSLLALIARSDIEDIAINLGNIYVYTTAAGWEYDGATPDGLGDALRVMMDRAGQRAPTPDYPIADAMLQVMVPIQDGTVRRKGVRINYIMAPASPYGDTITLRISNYRTNADLEKGSLALLCQNRLPPIPRPKFAARDFPRGDGILTPEAANYILGVMVHGGTLVIAGTTGSGKTFVGQRILQEMLDYYPRGAIRLFIVEDSNEIVLNGWNGDGKSDTGNIVYSVTRPEIRGGPPPVTMYDLIRAALRSRPHGVVIGEARGAEAWELIRAAATGHGHSAFTIHATSAEHPSTGSRQALAALFAGRAGPPGCGAHTCTDRRYGVSEAQIAQSFAEAITAAVYIERNPQHGQIVREIVEVSPIVERTAGRPSFSPLFRFDPAKGLVPTGNRPMRPGFRASDLDLPENYFRP